MVNVDAVCCVASSRRRRRRSRSPVAYCAVANSDRRKTWPKPEVSALRQWRYADISQRPESKYSLKSLKDGIQSEENDRFVMPPANCSCPKPALHYDTEGKPWRYWCSKCQIESFCIDHFGNLVTAKDPNIRAGQTYPKIGDISPNAQSKALYYDEKGLQRPQRPTIHTQTKRLPQCSIHFSHPTRAWKIARSIVLLFMLAIPFRFLSPNGIHPRLSF